MHTFFFNPNTEPIWKRWENTTSGHKAEATNLQNTNLLCFEFEGLVELLSDPVLFVNLHNFLGIYTTFPGNLRHFGENFTPIYTMSVPGAKKPINARK